MRATTSRPCSSKHSDSSAYGEAFSHFYDELYGTDDQSVAAAVACLASLAGQGPVLEFGVGTGRLALPLARRLPPGSVWGVDSSPAMLYTLAAKDPERTVTAWCGDMSSIEPDVGPRSCSLIFAAFNTFYLLTDRSAQSRCLRSSSALLSPGGRLVLEVYRPAPQPADFTETSRVGTTRAGQPVTVTYRRSAADPEVFDGEVRLGPEARGTWSIRPIRTGDLDAMAAQACFTLESRWGDWSGRPYFESVGRHVSIWRRPGPDEA
jgi:SAM-dependent methyltransferase